MNMPFFSVIIPTFNRRPFLEKAVESVLSQTCGDFELIIVDDGSTDGTGRMIQGCEDARLHYFFQPQRGVACARNQGLARARGACIAFLDSDDWWLKEKLARFREVIDEFPEIKIFHSQETWYRRGALLNPNKKHRKPDGFVYRDSLPLCCISISTAVIFREVFEKAGVFDESFEACEDYDFWLRATARFPVKLIPEYLTEKDGGRPDQLSAAVWGLDRFRIRALARMLASGILSPEDHAATFRELKKKAGVFIKGARKRGKSREVEFYRDLIARYDPAAGRPDCKAFGPMIY